MIVELEKHRHLQNVMPLPAELKEGSNAEAKGRSEAATSSASNGSRIVGVVGGKGREAG